MDKKFRPAEKRGIRKILNEVVWQLKPFVRKYKNPVLVHSTPSVVLFRSILNEGKIKVPKKIVSDEHIYIEKLLGFYPSIFFSLGFVYASSYGFKYNLIFDLNLLRKGKYFQKSIGFQSYRKAFRYWEENNPEYVDILRKKNKACKEVLNKYFNYAYKGKKRSVFEFWKIEKELVELIESYSQKKELIKIFKKISREQYVRYPESIKAARSDWKKEYSPEVIIKEGISLDNKDFLGFYIKGKVPVGIKKILVEKYPDKILFDGKKIEKVEDLFKGLEGFGK